MITENMKEKIKGVKELKVVNTDKLRYRFDPNTNTLYIPTNETDFSQMFTCYDSLKEIEFCIDNKIEEIEGMFSGCSELRNIIFTKKLNLENVISLYNLFNNCISLEKIDLSNTLTSGKLSSTVSMFYNCYSLKEVHFGDNFHTKNIIDSVYMFAGCINLENIFWNHYQQFNNLKYINGMFYSCKNLKQIDLRGLNFNKVETSVATFYETSSKLEVLVNNTFKEEILYQN